LSVATERGFEKFRVNCRVVKIEQIESKDNRRLVRARKVRDGRVPGYMFIEGRRLAEEALASGISLEECFVADDLSGDEIVEAAIVARVATAVVSERLFRQVADTDTPQGVILIAKRPVAALTDLEYRVGSTVLP